MLRLRSLARLAPDSNDADAATSLRHCDSPLILSPFAFPNEWMFCLRLPVWKRVGVEKEGKKRIVKEVHKFSNKAVVLVKEDRHSVSPFGDR